jgi:topoisomerase-4 subunit A
VKSFKAKGKRITTFEIETINELEPARFPESEKQESAALEIEIEPEEDDKIPSDILDEITGQMKIF